MVNSVALTACSPQWAAGFAFSLNAAAFVGLTTVMLPPDMTFPIDTLSISQICKHTGAEGLITPPSLIEELHKDQNGLEFLKALKYVSWVGAGLNQSVGDSLVPYTHLIPIIGSTERGVQLSFEPEDRSLWNSFDFIPETGPLFEQVGDNLYELNIARYPTSHAFQGIFYTFPGVKTFATAEIYSSVLDTNESKRWVFQGRKDDLVKLSWLAKFHAIHIEDAIAKHDNVKAVVVGGEGRDVPYIIIEPKDQDRVKNAKDFVDEIYDHVIRSINKKDDDEIQIPREMVMLIDPAIPFKRTLKMTIMRKEIEKAYQTHIDDLYKQWKDKAIRA
jgi:acyl-coenzyme A synthetase/AMP-(fatty) acid ligase